jgi:hypothetical protein
MMTFKYILLFLLIFIIKGKSTEVISHDSTFADLSKFICATIIEKKVLDVKFKIEGKNHIFTYYAPLIDGNKRHPWHALFIQDENKNRDIKLKEYQRIDIILKNKNAYILEDQVVIKLKDYLNLNKKNEKICFLVKCNSSEVIGDYYEALKFIDTTSNSRYMIELFQGK